MIHAARSLALVWLRVFGGLRLRSAWLLCAGLLWWSSSASALAVPELRGRVNDYAGVLSPDVASRVEAVLAGYERQTGHQLALLTIKSLEGDPIEDFSIRVVERWQLGKKGKDDGILLLVVTDERQLRIEVGYGLEGDLPDALSGRIIREQMVPVFRAEGPERGILVGLDAIMAATGGTPAQAEPVRERGEGRPRGKFGLAPLLLFFVLWLLFGGFGRGGRAGAMPIFFGGLGGGGFRGGGGGGFGGGGGGFGGGGASGRW